MASQVEREKRCPQCGAPVFRQDGIDPSLQGRGIPMGGPLPAYNRVPMWRCGSCDWYEVIAAVPARAHFLVDCPNGHKASHEFEPSDLRKQLEDGSLRFYCIQCDQSWSPSAIELALFKERLEGHGQV